MYDKNFKSLKKKIEEGIRKWKDFTCSWIDRINIVKNDSLTKIIYRFNAMLIKIPAKFFTHLKRTVMDSQYAKKLSFILKPLNLYQMIQS